MLVRGPPRFILPDSILVRKLSTQLLARVCVSEHTADQCSCCCDHSSDNRYESASQLVPSLVTGHTTTPWPYWLLASKPTFTEAPLAASGTHWRLCGPDADQAACPPGRPDGPTRHQPPTRLPLAGQGHSRP